MLHVLKKVKVNRNFWKITTASFVVLSFQSLVKSSLQCLEAQIKYNPILSTFPIYTWIVCSYMEAVRHEHSYLSSLSALASTFYHLNYSWCVQWLQFILVFIVVIFASSMQWFVLIWQSSSLELVNVKKRISYLV